MQNSIMDILSQPMQSKEVMSRQPINMEPIDVVADPAPKKVAPKQKPKKKPVMDALKKPSTPEKPTPKEEVEKPAAVKKSAPREERSAPSEEVSTFQVQSTPTILDSLTTDLQTPAEVVEEKEKGFIESGVDSLKNITNDYPNFWVGAAPTLVGALLGVIGEGAEQGGNALMQRYKDERDANILDMKAKRATASKSSDFSKMQKVNYRGEDGNLYVGSYNPMTGEKFDKDGVLNPDLQPKLSYESKKEIAGQSKHKWDKLAGKHKKMFTHPITGRPTIWDKTTDSFRTPTEALIPLDKDQQKYIMGIQKELRSGINRKTTEDYRRMGKSISGFASNVPERHRISFKNMAKALEGGKLSDFDMIYLQGTFSIIENARRQFGQQFTMGKMNETQRKNFSDELTRAMEEGKALAKERYERIYRDGRVARLTPDQMKEYIGEPIGLYDHIIYKDAEDGKIYKEPMSNLEEIRKDKNATIQGFQ